LLLVGVRVVAMLLRLRESRPLHGCEGGGRRRCWELCGFEGEREMRCCGREEVR
jgi:hypothetical protein